MILVEFISFLPLELEMGLLAGLAVAFSGYVQAYSKKDKDGNREKFSVDKFVTTTLIGGGAGLWLAFIGNFDGAISLFLVNAGIVAIVGSLIKAFLRLKWLLWQSEDVEQVKHPGQRKLDLEEKVKVQEKQYLQNC